MNGAAFRPASDAVFTMWPSPCSIMRGTNARIPWTTPIMFTPIVHSHPASGTSHVSPPAPPTPALLHAMCAVPKRSNVEFAKACTWSSSLTSHTQPAASMPSAANSATAASSGPASMSASATCIPAWPNASASARPMPLAPPVMATTLPLSSCIVSSVRSGGRPPVADQAQQLGAAGARRGVVREQRDEARRRSGDRSDAVEATTALEEHQCARFHRDRGDPLRRATLEDRGDVVVALVGRGTRLVHTLEVAAVLGGAQRDRHHEVGLVEMPRELVGVGHRRDVEGTERVVVPVEALLAERE